MPDPRIDATAAVPIDLASKLALGAVDLGNRALAEWHERGRQARLEAARLHIWWDRQHLNPDQVMQLIVLLAYGVITLADAWLHRGR